MNVENDWDGEMDYDPVEGPSKVSDKEVWETLKRIRKVNHLALAR